MYFSAHIWYNKCMKSTNDFQVSNADMVTISRAEYENLQAHSKRVSELESRMDVLMGSSAAQGLAYCNLLVEIEQGLSEETAEERYKERLEQAKPALDAMLAWANSRTAAPKSALEKAFTYLKEQWPYLTNYLKDGRLEFSNNRAERSIKPFVIDRKNFLFANTPKGASGSAVMFSLIQTAIENALDAYRYLTWMMKEANTADLTDPAAVEQLLPWNVPEEYRTKQSRERSNPY